MLPKRQSPSMKWPVGVTPRMPTSVFSWQPFVTVARKVLPQFPQLYVRLILPEPAVEHHLEERRRPLGDELLRTADLLRGLGDEGLVPAGDATGLPLD